MRWLIMLCLRCRDRSRAKNVMWFYCKIIFDILTVIYATCNLIVLLYGGSVEEKQSSIKIRLTKCRGLLEHGPRQLLLVKESETVRNTLRSTTFERVSRYAQWTVMFVKFAVVMRADRR